MTCVCARGVSWQRKGATNEGSAVLCSRLRALVAHSSRFAAAGLFIRSRSFYSLEKPRRRNKNACGANTLIETMKQHVTAKAGRLQHKKSLLEWPMARP